MSDFKTNVDDFLGELNGGVFKDKVAHLLSEVALGTINNGDGRKKGKVTIELSFNRIGDTEQLIVEHTLSQSTPTRNGKKSEVNMTETPMFVGKGGVLSVNPPKEEQGGQFHLAPVGQFKGAK